MPGARGATGAAGARGIAGDAGRNGEPGPAGARVSLLPQERLYRKTAEWAMCQLSEWDKPKRLYVHSLS